MFSKGKRPPGWFLALCAILINVMWAFCYPLAKILLTTVSPIALTAWRSLITAMILLPLLRKRDFPVKWQKRDVMLFGVMGVIGCAAASILQYFGTHFTLSANVALLIGLEPLLTNLLAVIFFADRMSVRQGLAFLLAIVGVYVVSVAPGALDLLSSRYLIGNLLVLVSVVAYALYTIAAKPLVGRFSARALTGIPFAISAVTTLIYYGLADPKGLVRAVMLTPREMAGILFISIFATVIVYAIWNWLLSWVSINRLTYSIFAQPPAGALFSVWLLGETLSGRFYLGTACIIIAVWLGHEKKKEALPHQILDPS